jgi:RNA polymerase sigma factor (sigma-70 family)
VLDRSTSHPAPDRRPGPERKLVLAAKAGGKPERAALVAAYVPQIRSVAARYERMGSVDSSELMQEGVAGLLEALERFDPERGTPFWAYAAWWVRYAMQRLVCELSGSVVLSDRAYRELARIKRVARVHVQAHRREATTVELAAGTGLAVEHVSRLLAATRTSRALDEPVGGDGGGRASLGDLLPDPRGEDGYERALLHVESRQVPAMLRQLGDRERVVVCGRFGLGERQQTLSELGSRLALSPERVRQIEQGALSTMRSARTATLTRTVSRRGAGGPRRRPGRPDL